MNKLYVPSVYVLLFLFLSCQGEIDNPDEKYPKQLGEIHFDPAVDDVNFQLCDTSTLIQSRLALSYVGGYPRIEEICHSIYDDVGEQESYNGFIMVRFLVNCKKETGRFRFQTLNKEFLHQECPTALTGSIQECIESLDEWIFLIPENTGKDHSHYLNFKIVNGSIQSILH